MAICRFIKRKDSKICTGDLDKQILIQTRKITTPIGNDVDFGENFEAFDSFWAMIQTVKGETVFDDSNIEQVVTHKFYVRFMPDITFEKWILFNNKRYRIVDVQNFNERNLFYEFRCNLRGPQTAAVNSL